MSLMDDSIALRRKIMNDNYGVDTMNPTVIFREHLKSINRMDVV